MIRQQQLPTTQGATSRTGPIRGRYSRWQVLVESGSGAAHALRLRGYEVWEASRDGGDLDALVKLDPDVIVASGIEGAIDPADGDEGWVLHEVRRRCLDVAVAEAQVDEVLGHATEPVVVRTMRPRSVLRTLAHRRGSFRVVAKAPGLAIRVDLIAGGLGEARSLLDDEPLVGLAAVTALLGAPPSVELSIDPIDEVGQSYVDYPSLQDALIRAVLRRAPEAVRGERRSPAATEDERTAMLGRPGQLLGSGRATVVSPPPSQIPTVVAPIRRPSAEADVLPASPLAESEPPLKHPTIALQRGRTPRHPQTFSPRHVREEADRSLESPPEEAPASPEPAPVPDTPPGAILTSWRERLWWAGWVALAGYAMVTQLLG